MTDEDDVAREHMQFVFILFGFLGLFSFSVVLTPVLFKRFRNYFFLRILAIISFCDALTAISYILNIHRRDRLHNDKICQFQGVLATLSVNMSISWTVALSTQLYSIVRFKKPYFSERSMHLIFWGIPTVVEIIPLFMKSTYGMDDHIPDMALGTCNIRTEYPGSEMGHIAFDINIYGVKIAAFVVLVILYVLTKREIDANNSLELKEVTRVMGLYPLALGVAWIPATISQISLYFYDAENIAAYMICLSFSSLYGVAVGIIFFYGNKQVRQSWYVLMTEFTLHPHPNPLKFDLRAKSCDPSNRPSSSGMDIESSAYTINDGDIVFRDSLESLDSSNSEQFVGSRIQLSSGTQNIMINSLLSADTTD